MAIVV